MKKEREEEEEKGGGAHCSLSQKRHLQLDTVSCGYDLEGIEHGNMVALRATSKLFFHSISLFLFMLRRGGGGRGGGGGGGGGGGESKRGESKGGGLGTCNQHPLTRGITKGSLNPRVLAMVNTGSKHENMAAKRIIRPMRGWTGRLAR